MQREKLPFGTLLAGGYHLHVRCRGCGRYGLLHHQDLRRRGLPATLSMSCIERRLRCGVCGHRGAETWLCTPGMPFTDDWRPPGR